MSAHQYRDMYSELGIDLDTLGCVMLQTETPETSFIEPDDLYYTDNNKLFWIDGRVRNSHVTLKYGLLDTVRRRHVDRVLEGAPLPIMLLTSNITMFASPYPEEPYECIVAEIELDVALRHGAELLELHQRLNYLPHINTFPDYRPHVTLAYVRKGWYDEHADSLRDKRPVFHTKGLDYGKMK